MKKKIRQDDPFKELREHEHFARDVHQLRNAWIAEHGSILSEHETQKFIKYAAKRLKEKYK